MAEESKECMPRLRFPEFMDKEWNIYPVSRFLRESQIAGSSGDIAKKLSVKLWGKGVAEKKENYSGSAATRYYIRKAGQFIYSKLDFLNQAFGIIPDNLDNYESTIDLPCFDFKKGISPHFFLYYVLRPIFYKKNGELADGGRKAKRVQQDMFLGFSIALPPLAEQQKIADCLSSLDELIEAHEQKRDALLEHKKGLMQRIFPAEGETTPRWRFPEFRKVGEWKKYKVGDLFTATRGEVLAMSKVQESRTDACPYPVYSSQTKNNGLAGFYSTYLYEDAITWTTDGANAGDVNYREGKFFCTNVCGVLLSKDGYCNKCVAEIINSISRKHVSYVGNPKLMNNVMKEIEIYIPSIAEQQKIADCLSSLDARIEAQEVKIASLREHKQGLMQRLFPQSL